ncbi:hypothetical protein A3D84_01205 [Candidatus Woesebacteria bacterium RIFCSPHIGHO2_02_FULL_42_20]|uniref:VIT family protein n=1 Tax=Candidatus Woesebacteria bacterium RIFCSPHIGHO2_12_FULL_41_24 TaxID=1802510 RepID=A0A1F8ARL5_9BACT|nr:MAG: hypothetical protein A2873_01325 [Candidatus Woesebacteria bacterium RIFCSPHIGHO2_01_FULL_42_80]OGM35870.1 MAG: hypothetical protein A3D84_01205 [Candidatus Woesebacteria bacterium RIFCSPHIGHO2_02_FULL_42_20]OGM53928.1 MAG: hypothetical protein A3E44_05970 [Candidatus Woesebacteria bacterium RIFCSPHIGHO2_12_FULL_41_24]OGM66120.1 MAG: hypothetical protein A2969_04065 [Candidatus Woesebacteria bacterium RIFCSPLOWO2_01_FULL_42_67]OGM71053.1 MAG: hypothetical protein A3I55_01780 [Candidatus
MVRLSKDTFMLYGRNFIFGVEDSLVSTVGLLSGVAVANVGRHTVFLTGMVLIFVEAFSMGVGSFLSEHSVEKFLNHNESGSSRPRVAGIIMFFSYFLSGFIPLLPYLYFQTGIAFAASIALSLASLFSLGLISAKLFKINLLRNGLEMLILGGSAILMGIVVGVVLRNASV